MRAHRSGIRLAVVLMSAASLMGPLIPASRAQATSDPNATFSFLQDGFTQELWATAETFPIGQAFASNGDVLTCYGGGHRFSASNTSLVHGSTIHAESQFPSGCDGLGLTNHPDGFVYNNAHGGVSKLDPNHDLALVAGPFGAPGATYGIAADPQTGNLVYVANDYSIRWVDAGLTTTGVFSTAAQSHGLIDQIAFDPTGNFLFLSGWGDHTLVILHRDGSVAQVITMSHQPDGIAFRATDPQFVATNDTDGTLDRFDFPNGDFTQPPVESLLGSGAGYGDHTAVGPDTCWYVSNGSTRYADGTPAGAGLVRICPGFAPPSGVGCAGPSDNLIADPGFEAPLVPLKTVSTAFVTASAGWTVDTAGGATVARSTAQAHSGSYSLQLEASDGQSGSASVRVPDFQPGVGWSLSTYVYPRPGGSETLDLAMTDPATSADEDVRVLLPPKAGPELMIGADSATAVDPLKQNTWHLVTLSGGTDFVELSVDAGLPAVLGASLPTLGPGATATLGLDVTALGTGPRTDLYFDDLSLRTCVTPAAYRLPDPAHKGLQYGAPLTLGGALGWADQQVATSGAAWFRLNVIAGTGGVVDDATYGQYKNLLNTDLPVQSSGFNVIGLLDNEFYVDPRGQGSAIWDDPSGAYVNAFAKQAARAATQLPQIHYWEIWNEPNNTNPNGAAIEPVTFARLLQATADSIRAVEPGATIISGGLTGDTATYLAATYAAGRGSRGAPGPWPKGRAPMDGIGLHLYTAAPLHPSGGNYPPALDLIDRLQSLTQTNLPIYITEMGWPTSPHMDAGKDTGVSPSGQAAVMVQDYFAVSQRPQVKAAIWYTFWDQGLGGNPGFGLWTAAQGRPKPAWCAFTGQDVSKCGSSSA